MEKFRDSNNALLIPVELKMYWWKSFAMMTEFAKFGELFPRLTFPVYGNVIKGGPMQVYACFQKCILSLHYQTAGSCIQQIAGLLQLQKSKQHQSNISCVLVYSFQIQLESPISKSSITPGVFITLFSPPYHANKKTAMPKS